MMYKNISNIHNCYGCGVCATICNRNIINIKLNSYGFYEPYIEDLSKCNNCGLCLDICSFSKNELSNKDQKPIHSYAAWSKKISIQRECSSGGVGYELGRLLINEGYEVCGVRYNLNKKRAEHYIASNHDELFFSIGSKYIQSYTVDGFKSINRNKKYLVTGTPCQIDSFRRYIRKFKVENNFVLMDFFCHSVPSMLAWQKYISEIEKNTGKVKEVSWRNKRKGWHESYVMSIIGENKNIYSHLSDKDVFLNLFLMDFSCNKACQSACKYKYNNSSADIRIGDLWGNTYSKNENGVSALISFTPIGDKWIKQLNCELIEHPFEIVAEGQMKKNCHPALLSPIVWKMLRSKRRYNLLIWKCLIIIEKIFKLLQRISNKINQL